MSDVTCRYQFDPFELDARERLLLSTGKPVALTPKAFDLLLVLVSNPGRLMEKKDLMQAVWPDSFVEEGNLTDNIFRLRRALGDGENGTRYIETVPKRGYRFVADVIQDENGVPAIAMPRDVIPASTQVSESEDIRVGTAPVDTALPRSAYHRHRRIVSMALAVFLLLSLAAVTWIAFRKKGSAPASPLRVVPVTSLAGGIGWPSLSPDGKQVAFAWEKESGMGLHIFVKLLDAGDPLQLTSGPGSETDPVWSPDSRYIAFIRTSSSR